MAIVIFVAVGLLVEWLALIVFKGWAGNNRTYFWGYALFTVFTYSVLVGAMFVPKAIKYPLVNFFSIIFFAKFLAAIFVLVGLGSVKISELTGISGADVSDSRRAFVKKAASMIGLVPLGLMTWGIFRTAGNFKIHKVNLTLDKLPEAFKGFRIVQVSDIHTGSFFSHGRMREAVEEILAQKPDIVVFSGDLVNNRTDEIGGYEEILAQIKAPMGVYSTLGNHDYGDYERWNSVEEKINNFQDMLAIHKRMGWDLLMNEHRIFERNGEKIALLGVENWGANLRFPKYGKLNLAHAGTENIPVKILISHDPSHWEAEVLKDYPDISLMMAGHTHGFQFGVEIPGIKWSPSQWVYKQWAGLYENAGRYLYVNRGLGCIGYMGRVGIRPEITVIDLV